MGVECLGVVFLIEYSDEGGVGVLQDFGCVGFILIFCCCCCGNREFQRICCLVA